MTTPIKYRISSTATKPVADSVKGAPLTSLEIDGNFRSIKDSIETIQSGYLPAGYSAPVEYAAGIILSSASQTVSYQGEVYAPKAAEVPFTASGTFEVAKFVQIQSVASVDLSASSGSSLVGYDGGTVQDVLDTLTGTSGAASVGYTPAGTGAVSTTAEKKLSEWVSVFDFMTSSQIAAVKSGTSSDDTAAFVAAQNASKFVLVPPGTYVLDNLRLLTNRKFLCSGYESTIIKQKTAGNYAINCLSDAATGQLLGVSFTKFKLIGAAGATVAALNIEANGIYAVTHSEFDYVARNTYSPLRMNSPSAGAIYNCDIRVTSDISVAGVISQGTYNNYDFFLTNVDSGQYIEDTSTSSFFKRLVTEGQVRINGQQSYFALLTVESWKGTPQSSVVRIAGARNSFGTIRVISVSNAEAPATLDIYGLLTAIDHFTIVGTYPDSASDYPAFFAAGSSGRISNVEALGVNRAVDSYTSGATLRKWTFDGAISSKFLTSPVTRNGVNVWVNNFATSGSTVTFGKNSTVNDWYDAFVLNIAGTLSTLTITIPQSPIDGQTATFCSAGAGGVTALTLSAGAGKSIVGAPAGLASGSSFTLAYSSADSTWYRVR